MDCVIRRRVTANRYPYRVPKSRNMTKLKNPKPAITTTITRTCCGLNRCGNVVEAIGADMIEIVDGKIKEIRDYHKRVRAAAMDGVPAIAPVQ